MGIRFYCPTGHKLNVKSFQAGRTGICPYCGTKFVIPNQSTRKSSKEERAAFRALAATSSTTVNPGSQNAAPGFTGAIPIAGSQPSSSSSPPIIEQAKGGDKTSAQPALISSQQDTGGTRFTSPILPTSADSITNMLNSDLLPDASATPTPAGPTDPFIAAGDVVWYVRPPSGGQYGPATSNIVRQWLAEGRIGPNSLVWREGWRDWQQASEVFHQLRSNNPPADNTTAPAASTEQNSVPAGQLSTLRTPKNMLKLTTVLIILTLIILLSLFVWAFTSKSIPATDKSGTHSTRLELLDTLSSNHLS
jgi:hypothetical protein